MSGLRSHYEHGRFCSCCLIIAASLCQNYQVQKVWMLGVVFYNLVMWSKVVRQKGVCATLVLGNRWKIWIPSSLPPSDPFVVTARPRVLISKRDPKDRLLEPFLGLAYSTLTLSLDLSFNRLLESRPCDSDQNDMIE
ncbi:uncharacterized protein LOC131328817 [Rhododendron vialii]|uniref:uncharacterized protein LOC131328817 n=1 Tax=Rhododendron vialii TaxID=182163 RepID=UPI00265EBA2E|nr:uncharacterized protein LOC131328817 [Rhododendron vialii]